MKAKEKQKGKEVKGTVERLLQKSLKELKEENEEIMNKEVRFAYRGSKQK